MKLCVTFWHCHINFTNSEGSHRISTCLGNNIPEFCLTQRKLTVRYYFCLHRSIMFKDWTVKLLHLMETTGRMALWCFKEPIMKDVGLRICWNVCISAGEEGSRDRWMWDGTKIILQIRSDLKANSLWRSTGSELLSKYEYFSVLCLLCTLVVELVCIRCSPSIWNSLFRQDHVGVTVKYLSTVRFSKQSCRHRFFSVNTVF